MRPHRCQHIGRKRRRGHPAGRAAADPLDLLRDCAKFAARVCSLDEMVAHIGIVNRMIISEWNGRAAGPPRLQRSLDGTEAAERGAAAGGAAAGGGTGS